jgi:hypothetical protein
LTAAENILALIAQIDPADIPAVLAACAARMAAVMQHSKGADDDGLVDAKEAARLLAVSPSFLYHRRLDFAVQVGRRRMYSRKGIQRFIARNAGR